MTLFVTMDEAMSHDDGLAIGATVLRVVRVSHDDCARAVEDAAVSAPEIVPLAAAVGGL